MGAEFAKVKSFCYLCMKLFTYENICPYCPRCCSIHRRAAHHVMQRDEDYYYHLAMLSAWRYVGLNTDKDDGNI